MQNILHTWLNDTDKGLTYFKLMENPHGMLQHRQFMQSLPLRLGLNKYIFDMCPYGQRFRKHSNAWTDLDWNPTGVTGNGLCNNGQCGQGSVHMSTGAFRHDYSLGQDPERYPKGPDVYKQVNSIPEDLAQEWLDCLNSAKVAGRVTGNTIIDLCSGYQHLKPVALRNGYNYVGIDIRGNRSDSNSYDFVASLSASLPPRKKRRGGDV